MPPKTTYRKKKRTYKKRVYRKSKTSMPLKVAQPKNYLFARSKENLLNLTSPDAGWITTLDNSLVKTFDFNLFSLPNPSDFTNLFGQYKLNMAIVKIFPSASQVLISTGPAGTQNMIITIWKNTHGVPLDATFSNAKLLEIQKKRQFMFPLNKPTTIKMYLKQLSHIYAGSTAFPDYGTVKPRYISTTEPNTPHYGMNVHIRKLDATAFGSNAPTLLVREKIYLTTRQVQ